MKLGWRALCGQVTGAGGGRLQRRGRSRVSTLVPDAPSQLEQLAARLLARTLSRFPEPHFNRPVRRAALEALEIAERTGYAVLLLPELFAELAVAAMLRAEYLRLGRI